MMAKSWENDENGPWGGDWPLHWVYQLTPFLRHLEIWKLDHKTGTPETALAMHNGGFIPRNPPGHPRFQHVPTSISETINIYQHQPGTAFIGFTSPGGPIGPIGPFWAVSLPIGASLVVLKAIDHQTIGVASGVRHIRQIPGTGPLAGSAGKVPGEVMGTSKPLGKSTVTTRVYPKIAILLI